jgi:hypothetical protein
MDVFKYKNPEHPTKMDEGQLINNIKSKLWIERYRDISEFELVGDIESDLHLLLPIGTFISHTDSTEIMIVENHEINENLGSPTQIKVTGRSFESFFENRIIGSNRPWSPELSTNEEYVLPADYTWNQAVKMIEDHIDVTLVFDFDDGIPYFEVITDVIGSGESVARSVRHGELYSAMLDLLSVDNLGIKVLRPGINSPFGYGPNVAVVVHKGEDLSQDIAFSFNAGEIESADYLWSNRTVKNAALVSGRWLENVVKLTPSGYNRRMMHLDASDIDSAYSSAPTGATRDAILMAMYIRGLTVLAAQRNVALIKAESKKDSVIYKYRQDYNVGDIVTVGDPYIETTSMRITEYVEIEDENGESGYPTLSIV